jgi:hypothetical protein
MAEEGWSEQKLRFCLHEARRVVVAGIAFHKI